MTIVAQGATLQYDAFPVEVRDRTYSNETEKRPGIFLASSGPKKSKE